jgi:protein-S-isoprenylcysteine O-methyltransferase Ste14
VEVLASWVVGAFAVVFVVGQQVVGVLAFRGHGRTPLKKQRTAPGEWMARIPGSLLLGFWIVFLPLHRPVSWMPESARLIGIPVIFGGLVVSLVAQRQLDRLWVNGVGIYSGHKLIDTGLYGIVRHPMYAGLILSFIGVAVLGACWATLFGSTCMCLAFGVRILQEDHLLKQRFQKSYPAYEQRVPALVPRRR